MAEKEYIEREAALECIAEDGCKCEYDLGYWPHNVEFQELIKEIPAADVKPVVRGRWLYHPEATWQYECDNCGCYVPGVWTYCPECGNINGPNTITELNPVCGADMRGGDAK